MQSTSVFLDIAKFADIWQKNADVSRTQGVCHVIHIYFRSSLGNCTKFHQCLFAKPTPPKPPPPSPYVSSPELADPE